MRRSLIASSFALLFSLSLYAADATNVAALAEAYEHPKLAPAAKVQGLSVGIGNMTFELTSGSASAVSAGGQIVGLYFVERASTRIKPPSRSRLRLWSWSRRKSSAGQPRNKAMP